MAGLEPPRCPSCPARPWLWKDTTTVGPDRPDQWRWYCTTCRARREPGFAERMAFTYRAVPAVPAPARPERAAPRG
ncbi:hypothetical protein FQU76_12470 [Streptomyces qinzhouensis]|uniref:Uncharacterized protein n=1 Tax=Streptomyces qinzhouensis TaxID=2599401 RepID=A0A5B8IF40_9ACTN|nr:hypothetical protein FQU76_12470 [Streptomyces qinzhouensis]